MAVIKHEQIDSQARLWAFLFIGRSVFELVFFLLLMDNIVGLAPPIALALIGVGVLAFTFRSAAMFAVFAISLFLSAVAFAFLSGQVGIITLFDMVVAALLAYLFFRMRRTDEEDGHTPFSRRAERGFPIVAMAAGAPSLLLGLGAGFLPFSELAYNLAMQLGIVAIAFGGAALLSRTPQYPLSIAGLWLGVGGIVFWVFSLITG